MDYAYLKPINRRNIHNSNVSDRNVNFPYGFWWPSWIYADLESCHKVPLDNKTEFVLGPPLDYETRKKVHRRELFQVPKMSNRLYLF